MLILPPYSRREDEQMQSSLKFSGLRNNLKEIITGFSKSVQEGAFSKVPTRKASKNIITKDYGQDYSGNAEENGGSDGKNINGESNSDIKQGKEQCSSGGYYGSYGIFYQSFHNQNLNYCFYGAKQKLILSLQYVLPINTDNKIYYHSARFIPNQSSVSIRMTSSPIFFIFSHATNIS